MALLVRWVPEED